jgi:NitT/TauT family transport system ATP-binding protein
LAELDVLTAENLRNEISGLWQAGVFPAKSVLIVTHNIEEAVLLLSDRIIILGSSPGRIRGEIAVDVPRPRNRNSTHFKALVDHIYTVMTNPNAEVGATLAAVEKQRSPYATPLPHARAGGISGLLELADKEGYQEDIYQLAERLRLDVDDLLPILDAAVLLGFAIVEQGDIKLTDAGREFARASILESKELFRRQVLERAPLVATIYQTLRETKTMLADFFLDVLDEHYPDEEAERQFATAVDWGRYAELFEYDAEEKRLTITAEE